MSDAIEENWDVHFVQPPEGFKLSNHSLAEKNLDISHEALKKQMSFMKPNYPTTRFSEFKPIGRGGFGIV